MQSILSAPARATASCPHHRPCHSSQSCREWEAALDKDMKSFDFLQRAQAYTEDLLDCLNEKAPSIERYEDEVCDVIEEQSKQTRRRMELRSSAERMRARRSKPPHHFWDPAPVIRRGEPGADSPPLFPHPEADEAVASAALAEYEASRDARRAKRAAAQDAPSLPSGWSSSEAEEADLGRVGDEGARLVARRLEVLRSANSLFGDAAPEFCEITHVRRRFAEWRTRHGSSYEAAYIDLCFLTLLAPLVRLQLLHWTPLAKGNGSIEGLKWYSDLMKESPGPMERGRAGGQYVILCVLKRSAEIYFGTLGPCRFGPATVEQSSFRRSCQAPASPRIIFFFLKLFYSNYIFSYLKGRSDKRLQALLIIPINGYPFETLVSMRP